MNPLNIQRIELPRIKGSLKSPQLCALVKFFQNAQHQANGIKFHTAKSINLLTVVQAGWGAVR